MQVVLVARVTINAYLGHVVRTLEERDTLNQKLLCGKDLELVDDGEEVLKCDICTHL